MIGVYKSQFVYKLISINFFFFFPLTKFQYQYIQEDLYIYSKVLCVTKAMPHLDILITTIGSRAKRFKRECQITLANDFIFLWKIRDPEKVEDLSKFSTIRNGQ